MKITAWIAMNTNPKPQVLSQQQYIQFRFEFDSTEKGFFFADCVSAWQMVRFCDTWRIFFLVGGNQSLRVVEVPEDVVIPKN